MRSTDERIAAVGQKTKELKRRQALRKSRISGLSAVAAALALVVGVGLAMPGMMAQMDSSEHLGASGMASIFSAGSGMGYVLIALLSFTLGVCVTMLCLHLQHAAKKPGPREEKGEKPDD